MARLRTGAWVRTATIQESHAYTSAWRGFFPARCADFTVWFYCSLVTLARILRSSCHSRLWNAGPNRLRSVLAGESFRNVGVFGAVRGRRGTPPALTCIGYGSIVTPTIVEPVGILLVDLQARITEEMP